MHEDFQRFEVNVLPESELSAKKKKHCDYLLSDRQGIIAFNPLHWFNLLMIFKSLIDIKISVASEKRLVIIAGALCRYSSRTIPNQIVLATDLTY